MMKNRIQKSLWNTFLIAFTVNMILILVICMIKTENHLPFSKMVILSIGLCGAWIVLYMFMQKIEKWFQKTSRITLPLFLLGYGVFLYVLAISGRNNPVHDQQAVYQGALYFAGLSKDIPWEYFATYTNNIIPAIFLGAVFKIGSLGGLIDPYYFAVLINVVQVLVVIYCIFNILKERNGIVAGWSAVFVMVMCVPIIGHTLALYTDSMSFCFAVVALRLWQINEYTKHNIKHKLTNVLIGVLIGIGALIKMTVLISVIAIFVFCIMKKDKEKICKSIIIMVVSVLIVMCANYVVKFLPCEEMRDNYGTPTISYFVGIGLKGNGGYIDNQEYMAKLNTIYGMEEKEEWSNQYIRENLHELWNKDHVIQKLRYNFANGGFGCTIFVHNLDEEHILYRMMHYEGDLYWRYSMLTTAYIYSLYILIVIEMCMKIFCEKDKEETSCCSVALIAIFGIMLYLMLFEANNRQLYNHLPWFVLVASCGLSDVLKYFKKIKCRLFEGVL